jgi:RNAse (barnase) inhibitor barstar
MARIRLDTAEIVDWSSFHDACHRAFGFPDFYGRNMDAWIDCMSDLTEMEDGITTLKLARGSRWRWRSPASTSSATVSPKSRAS